MLQLTATTVPATPQTVAQLKEMSAQLEAFADKLLQPFFTPADIASLDDYADQNG